MGDFDFYAARNAAPGISRSPSLLNAASQDSQDPAGSAQLLDYVSERNVAAEAIQKVKESNGFFGSVFKGGGLILHGLGKIPGTSEATKFVAESMSKPLELVQHEYRYMHDVEARHGVGALVDWHLYADTPSHSERYGDSWERTKHGDAWADESGQVHEGYLDDGRRVSWGRDLTSLIPWFNDEGTKRYSVASGLLDGVFDLALDPTLALGKVNKAGRVLDLNKTELSVDSLTAAQQLRLNMAKSITLKDADSFDVAMQSARVQKAVDRIRETTSPSDMRRLMPRATDQEIRELVAASTREDVRDVWLRGMQTSNILNKAPLLSLMSPVSDRLRNVGAKDAEKSAQLGQDIVSGVEGVTQKTNRRERFQRRFLTRLPLDADPNNPNPLHSFHLDGPNAGDVVHGITKYSFDERVADAVRDAFLSTPDLAHRQVILANTVKAAAWNMGFKKIAETDPGAWAKFTQDLADDGSRGRFYGIDGNHGGLMEGRVHLPDRANQDATSAAAIFSGQAGRANIPTFVDLRRAIADHQGVVRSVGFRSDDFLYNHLTRPVFKRLALFSGGFALRIGMGEGLYRALDDGTMPYLKSQLGSWAAKGKYKMSTGERQSRLAAALYAGLDKMNPAEAQFGFMVMHEHDGHLLPGALDGDHIARNTTVSKRAEYVSNLKKMDQAKNGRKTKWVVSDREKELRPADADYDFFWHRHLNDIAQSPEGRVLAQTYLKHLRSADPELALTRTIDDHTVFLQSKGGRAATRNMTRSHPEALKNNDGHRGFAATQVKALRGAVIGKSGQLHEHLLEDLAQGKVDLRKLNDIPLDHKPKAMLGMETHPEVSSAIDHIFDVGWHKAIHPVINAMSRNGSFIRHGNEQYQLLLKHGLPERDAFRIAQERAIHRLLPDIHNPNVRTQFSELHRNYMPFFFAQDQAYRRWARLAVRSPESLRKLQLLHQAGVNTGFVHKDPATGEETFMYPMSGFVGAGLREGLNVFGVHTLDGVPLNFSGNMSGLATVTPFAEDLGVRLGGPVTGIPMALLEKMVPESASFVENARGEKGSGATMWDQIFPNAFVKNMLTFSGADHSRSFNSSMMLALQSAYYKKLNGLSPEDRAAFLKDPQAKQELLDEAKNYARVLYLTKAVMGELVPTQPQQEIGVVSKASKDPDRPFGSKLTFNDEFAKFLREEKTVGEAIEKFQAAHEGEDVTPFTVFQSEGVAGGYVPPSQDALDYFERHKDLLSKLPYGGAYLIPQVDGDGDALKIYNEQLAVGMRKKRTPEEFQDALYLAAGNAQYYELRDQRDETLAKYGDRDAALRLFKAGKDVPTVVADDADMRKQIDTRWQDIQKALSNMNPVWASQRGDKTRAVRRDSTLEQFDVLFAPENAGLVEHNRQYELVGQLHRYYQLYHQQRQFMSDEPGTGLTEDIKSLDENWQAYLSQLEGQVPELKAVIQGVYREVK